MDYVNPLDVDCKDIRSRTTNSSGRPSKVDKITFGPQPQSHISMLLQKTDVDSLKVFCHDTSILDSIKSNRPTKSNKILYGSKSQCHISKLLQSDCETITYNFTEGNAYTLTKLNSTNCAKNNEPHSRVKDITKTSEENIPFTCDYPNCTYTSKFSSNLYKHRRTHLPEKPYMCDLCSFQTKFVNSLKVHKRTHTDERPYCCINCSYRCNNSSNLKKHIKHRHSITLPS